MLLCWHCGCNFEKNDPGDTKCPECGKNAISVPSFFGIGFIISVLLVGCQPEENPNVGAITFGIIGMLITSIFLIILSIKAKELNKKWLKAQKKKNKATNAKKSQIIKKNKSAFTEYGMTSELSPFISMGKSNGENVRFDIKPDREIEIEYQDASGEITRRCITAQIIETAWGGLVIKAFCHLRGGQRSFKLENIHRLYENGHEINIVDWLEQIGFSQNRRVKKRIAKEKLSAMVDKMSNTALDEFIKNSN